MEKEFVPYDLALKLKELGFDEPCFGSYVFGDELNIKYCEDQFITDSCCLAPTFSQAFRWFRINYNLDSICRQIELNGKSYWKINKIETEDKIKGYSNFTNSYEQAEIACLEKLIKIVENNL